MGEYEVILGVGPSTICWFPGFHLWNKKKKKNGLVSETHVSTQESMKYPWSLCSCLRRTYVILFPFHICCTLLFPSFSDPENNNLFF